jgi:hypothetical protein
LFPVAFGGFFSGIGVSETSAMADDLQHYRAYIMAPYVVNRYPLLAKRVEEAQSELQKIYDLARKKDE